MRAPFGVKAYYNSALAYDAFHNLSSIGIEGKSEPLASYLYTTGGRPKSVTYANGDSVLFVYNAKGQVIEERWKDKTGVEKARYKYAYDGNGVAEREPSR